jgi:hypothetical protein
MIGLSVASTGVGLSLRRFQLPIFSETVVASPLTIGTLGVQEYDRENDDWGQRDKCHGRSDQ